MEHAHMPIKTFTDIQPGDHLCCIYSTDEEHRAVLTPYLRTGLERNERVFYIVDARTRDVVINYLKTDGVDVDYYLDKGQFTILTVADSYMKGGVFDPDAMIVLLRAETQKALDEGYSALRVTGEMSWALRGLPGSKRLIEYENKLNTFFPGSRCLAICQYDRRLFDATILLDILRTHPFAFIGANLYDNFYFIPPGEALKPDQSLATLDRWIKNIIQRKETEKSLGESGQRIIFSLESADIGAWDLDLVTHTAWRSLRHDQIFGYEELLPEWTYEMFLDHVLPEDRSIVDTKFGKALENFQEWDFECRIRRKDGAIRQIWAKGRPEYNDLHQPVNMFGIVQDITERKLAENALRESKALVDAVVENVPFMMFLKEAKDLRFVIFNRAGEELLGYDRQALLGKNNLDLFPPEQAAQFMTKDREVLDGDTGILDIPEEFITTAKKGVRLLHTRKVCIRGTDGTTKFLLGISEDITDRKAAEAALKESQNRSTMLLEAIPDMMFILSRDGVYRDFSVPDPRVLAVPVDRIIGTNIRDSGFKKESTDAIMYHIGLTLETKKIQQFEYDLFIPDGEHQFETRMVALSEDSVLGIVRDITERRCAEKAVRESEQKFRDLFENSRDGIVIAESATQKFIDSNETFSRMLGYNPEEIKNLGIRDIHPEDSLPHVFEVFEKMVKHETDVGENIPIKRKDGTLFYADISMYPLSISDKGYQVGVFRDITERKKADDLIKHFNEELEQQVKSRTKDLNASLDEQVILLREVHHRVKNNLQIIISLLNLQSRQITEPGVIATLKDSIQRVRAMSMVYEKIYQSESLSQIDLADYVRFLSAQIVSNYGIDTRKVTVGIDIEKSMIDINSAIPLGLILNELISNALRHGFPGGRSGTVSITGRYGDKALTVTVKDDGVGLPQGLDWRNIESLGFRLINILVDQLQGTIELDRHTGTAFTIVVKEKEKGGNTVTPV